MSVTEYREEIRPYADREFDILAARMRGQLTDEEYGECRMMAYFAYGYLAAARRASARRKARS